MAAQMPGGTDGGCGMPELTRMKKRTLRCPYCGRFTQFLWIETDHWGSSWHWQTGIVDGKWICEQCGSEV